MFQNFGSKYVVMFEFLVANPLITLFIAVFIFGVFMFAFMKAYDFIFKN